MPGLVSSLLHSASGAVVAEEQGQQDRQTRLLAALKRQQDEELRKAQISNLTSEARDRDLKANQPQKYAPTSRDEAVNFYKDTHPVKDTGPVPGSADWYKMREGDYKLRAKYHVNGNSDRADIPLNHALTTVGQEIDDNRADINLADKGLKKYEDVNVTTRPTNPKRVPQFLADSTDAANLTAGRRRLVARDSTLNVSRDRMASEQRRRLGFKMDGAEPATPAPAATSSAGSPSSAGMEAEIQQAKAQLNTVFNSPDATAEDKQTAQQAYYQRRQRIQSKYGQH